MKKFIHINNCYGGPCSALKREYDSPEEFQEDFNNLLNLSEQELSEKYYMFHPLLCSEPVLLEIELADDEVWDIDEYDGLESLTFRKKLNISSKIIAEHKPKID